MKLALKSTIRLLREILSNPANISPTELAFFINEGGLLNPKRPSKDEIENSYREVVQFSYQNYNSYKPVIAISHDIIESYANLNQVDQKFILEYYMLSVKNIEYNELFFFKNNNKNSYVLALNIYDIFLLNIKSDILKEMLKIKTNTFEHAYIEIGILLVQGHIKASTEKAKGKTYYYKNKSFPSGNKLSNFLKENIIENNISVRQYINDTFNDDNKTGTGKSLYQIKRFNSIISHCKINKIDILSEFYTLLSDINN